MTTEADRERYGRAAYEGYGDSVGWRVFSGAEMPQWDETQERIREAWRAAGEKVADVALADAGTQTSDGRAAAAPDSNEGD